MDEWMDELLPLLTRIRIIRQLDLLVASLIQTNDCERRPWVDGKWSSGVQCSESPKRSRATDVTKLDRMLLVILIH